MKTIQRQSRTIIRLEVKPGILMAFRHVETGGWQFRLNFSLELLRSQAILDDLKHAV